MINFPYKIRCLCPRPETTYKQFHTHSLVIVNLRQFKQCRSQIVPYSKGTLKAEGIGPSPITPLLCNSNLCDSVVTLSTAEEPACIRLSADRAVLNADGQDLAFVTIEIVDKNGNVCPNAEIPLTASLASSDISAAILAFGNANLQDCDPYYDLTHKTWKGRAMLVVKAGKQPSDITLKVASESQEASIVITTK